MSQIRLFQLNATPYVDINNALRQYFTPVLSRRSQFHKIVAILIATFFTFASVVHSLLTKHYQSDGQILLLWILSCIFVSIQLALTCCLIFVIAPGIQLYFELVAWMSDALGSILCSLLGVKIPGSVIFAIAFDLSFFTLAFGALTANDSSSTDRTAMLLDVIWSCSFGILIFANLRPETCGPLFECVTIMIYWFNISTGVVLTIAIKQIVTCLGVGGIMLSAFVVVYAVMHLRDYYCFDINHGTLLQFDDCIAIPPPVSIRFM